jgi:predicted O-methyltransferase YrrM
VAGERNADEIQRDIEASRAALAQAVDELAYRTNPKRVVENTRASLKAKAQTPEGKAVIYGAGAIVGILILRKIFKKH